MTALAMVRAINYQDYWQFRWHAASGYTCDINQVPYDDIRKRTFPYSTMEKEEVWKKFYWNDEKDGFFNKQGVELCDSRKLYNRPGCVGPRHRHPAE